MWILWMHEAFFFDGLTIRCFCSFAVSTSRAFVSVFLLLPLSLSVCVWWEKERQSFCRLANILTSWNCLFFFLFSTTERIEWVRMRVNETHSSETFSSQSLNNILLLFCGCGNDFSRAFSGIHFDILNTWQQQNFISVHKLDKICLKSC